MNAPTSGLNSDPDPAPQLGSPSSGARETVLTNEVFDAGQRDVLESIASGATLSEILERIVRLVEAQAAGMMCSVLLMDRERKCLRHGAAPSLPREYSLAIDGLGTGPQAGSCGTAAHLGERVIVEDIGTHPFWEGYKQLALPFDLRACWSSPIFSPARQVLGTFAMYYREPRGPSDREIQWVDVATHLAAIAILRNESEQALRRSESRFRQIVETTYDGVWLVDVECRTTFVNRRAAGMLGSTVEEMMGRSAYDFIDAEDTELARANLARRMQGVSEQHEFRYRRKDGTDLWTIVAATPQYDEHGAVIGSLGLITDITERKQVEEALRASEQQLSLVYNNVKDSIFCLAVEGEDRYRFLSVNRAFLNATGLQWEQVAGRRVHEVIPQPSLSLVLSKYRQAIRDRNTVRWDEVTKFPSGTKVGEVSVAPLFNEDGACTHLIGAVHDVTERKRIEEKLRDQAALLDRAKDAIIIRNLEGFIQYWNKSAERLYGWTLREAYGRRVADLIYPDRAAFDEAQRQLVEAGEWSGELHQTARDGRHIVVETRWILVRDDPARPNLVFAINTDVTEKRKLEAQVLRAQRMDGLGTLAGGIAHDFNNVLTAVISYVALASEAIPEGHPARQFLEEVDKAGARATSLVRRILTFSRQHEPKRKPTMLQPVIEEALQLLRPTLDPLIEIRTRLAPDARPILADATQIHQVVMNLCLNAAHAIGGHQGVLGVRLEPLTLSAEQAKQTPGLREGPHVRLTVSDTGCGMSAETLDRIFDPFFTTKAHGQGTGLGLSVVYGIVKSHEGVISVTSAPGEGSTFRVDFPAAIVPVPDTPIVPRHDLSGHGERVLHVDDEHAIVSSMGAWLRQLGYHVTAFTDPIRALEAFRADPTAFDVVVTDLGMPGKSGNQLAQELAELRPGIPIIMTTGSRDTEQLQFARQLGVVELIEKPHLFGPVAQALSRLFRKSREKSQS